jgi:hypothetical protein
VCILNGYITHGKKNQKSLRLNANFYEKNAIFAFQRQLLGKKRYICVSMRSILFSTRCKTSISIYMAFKRIVFTYNAFFKLKSRLKKTLKRMTAKRVFLFNKCCHKYRSNAFLKERVSTRFFCCVFLLKNPFFYKRLKYYLF